MVTISYPRYKAGLCVPIPALKTPARFASLNSQACPVSVPSSPTSRDAECAFRVPTNFWRSGFALLSSWEAKKKKGWNWGWDLCVLSQSRYLMTSLYTVSDCWSWSFFSAACAGESSLTFVVVEDEEAPVLPSVLLIVEEAEAPLLPSDLTVWLVKSP